MVTRRLIPKALMRRLQRLSEEGSPSTVIITTILNDVPDGHGGYRPGGTVVNTYVARHAPVGQRTAREQVLSEKYTDSELKLVVLPVDAEVHGTSTLMLDGVPHEVVGILPLTSYPFGRKIITREVSGPSDRP